MIKIESPCTENFPGMQKNKLGRHCELCNKTVIDFTKQSNEQIKNYLSEANSSVCGRFKTFQLEQKTGFEKLAFTLREKIFGFELKPLRITLLAFLGGVTAFTTSCMGKAQNDYNDFQQDKKTSSSDSLKKDMRSESSKKN